MTPATNFFAIADGQSMIAAAAGSQFTAINGQIIVTHEYGGSTGQEWFDRIWFDGTYLQTQQLQFTSNSTVNLVRSKNSNDLCKRRKAGFEAGLDVKSRPR